MNMTKTFKKVGVLAIVLLMIAALVGCGGNQEEKQWEEDVTAIINPKRFFKASADAFKI